MVSGRESQTLRGQTPICRRFRPDAAGSALFSILGQTPCSRKSLNFKQIVSSAGFGRGLVTAAQAIPKYTNDLLGIGRGGRGAGEGAESTLQVMTIKIRCDRSSFPFLIIAGDRNVLVCANRPQLEDTEFASAVSSP